MKIIRYFWIIIVVITLFNVGFYLMEPGGETALLYVSDNLPVLCSLLAVVCLIYTQKSLGKFDYIKSAWMMILIGIFSFFIGETIYAYLEIGLQWDMNENFPVVADFFWCFGYLPILIGLFTFFYGYKKSGLPMGDFTLYGFIAITIFFMLAIVIYFLLIPIVEDQETDLLAKIAYVFYPVADMLVVVPSVLLIYITSLFGSSKVTRPIKFLAFGFLFITIADLLYSFLGWKDLYGSGNLIDVAWHLGYLFIALAALYQKQLVESLKGI